MSEAKAGSGLAINAKNYLHPRRFWLLHYRANEIARKVSSLLPERYEAGAAYAEVRKNGVNLSVSTEPPNTPNFDSALKNAARSENENVSAINPESPWNNSAISGAEAAALYGIDTFEKFQQVDEYVYEAMSKLAGENVATISDLHSTLGEYKHDFWGSLAEKAHDKWKGHLAEVYAHDDFSEAGNHVEWPKNSNQVGWDLSVDGHEVNVKLVADSSGLYSHFDKFPDIPVVVPHDTDLGGLAEHAFHFDPSLGLDSGLREFLALADTHKIIVDEAMSAAVISSHASDAADVAIGGTASVDAHIPWITAATAGWREGHLLLEDKTDLMSAGKNLASDVVGRGGGAFLGAKAGALAGGGIGSIFPGAGNVAGATIGGVVGAIGGAIGGGKASAVFKRKELDAAVEKAQSAEVSLRLLQEQLERVSNTEFSDAKARQQNELEAIRHQEQAKIYSAADQLKQWRDSSMKLTAKAAMEWIPKAESQLNHCVEEVVLGLKQQGFWRRWVWPSIEVLALEQSTVIVKEYQLHIDKFRDGISERTMIEVDELFTLFGEIGILRQQVYSRLAVIERERIKKEGDLRNTIQSAYRAIIKRRQQAFSELSATATRISENIRAGLAPVLNEMSEHIEKIRVEKAKLGMS